MKEKEKSLNNKINNDLFMLSKNIFTSKVILLFLIVISTFLTISFYLKGSKDLSILYASLSIVTILLFFKASNIWRHFKK